MPVDSPETFQAGALSDIIVDRRRESVTSKGVVPRTIEENGFGLAEDERFPTADELSGPNKLLRVAAPIPWAVYTVAFVELCERFSYYGTQIVYSNYVARPLPPVDGPPGSSHLTGAGGGTDQGVSGALGQGTKIAAGINTFNTFWVYCVSPSSQYCRRSTFSNHFSGPIVRSLHC